MKTRTKKFLAAAAFAATALAGAATAARAAETLTYTGNAFVDREGPYGTSAPDPAWGTSVDLTLTLPVAAGYTGAADYYDSGPTLDSFLGTAAGGFTIDQSSTTGYSIILDLVDGIPVNWSIAIGGPSAEQVGTVNVAVSADGPEAYDYAAANNQIYGTADYGSANGVHSDPGVWALVTSGVSGVPEPSTWAMMVAGFGAIGLALRRKPRAALAAV